MNELKTANRNQEVQLSTRDWKLLSALEVWGVLGLGQLNGVGLNEAVGEAERVRLFFNETGRADYWTRLSKRLGQLQGMGLIRAHFYMNHPKLFTLTSVGHELLESRGLARLPGYRDSIADSLAGHELMVAAAGLVMTELLGLKVSTERERYTWSRNGGRSPAPERGVSDLWVTDGSQAKAIEVELSQKSQSSYKQIFEAYRDRLPSGGVVLYITAWPTGVSCILDHAREFRAPFVYACSLADFRASAGRAPFRGAADDGTVSLARQRVEATR